MLSPLWRASYGCTMGKFLLMAFVVCATSLVGRDLQTRNVVMVTIDGLRWQEVFRGADDALFNREHGGVMGDALMRVQREFGQGGAPERRATLMPFLWGQVMQRGQIFGN